MSDPRLLTSEELADARHRSDRACRRRSTTAYYWLAQDFSRLLAHIDALTEERDRLAAELADVQAHAAHEEERANDWHDAYERTTAERDALRARIDDLRQWAEAGVAKHSARTAAAEEAQDWDAHRVSLGRRGAFRAFIARLGEDTNG